MPKSQINLEYEHPILQFDSMFVAGPIMLGIISLVFIVPNISLRIKKIPPRKYMSIIAAGILLFFGVPWVWYKCIVGT